MNNDIFCVLRQKLELREVGNNKSNIGVASKRVTKFGGVAANAVVVVDADVACVEKSLILAFSLHGCSDGRG